MSTARQARLDQAAWRDSEPEWSPDNSLEKQIARIRKEMGEARWKQLNDEWEAGQ